MVPIFLVRNLKLKPGPYKDIQPRRAVLRFKANSAQLQSPPPFPLPEADQVVQRGISSTG